MARQLYAAGKAEGVNCKDCHLAIIPGEGIKRPGKGIKRPVTGH